MVNEFTGVEKYQFHKKSVKMHGNEMYFFVECLFC